jgi:CubicO group peptidase (beta-lactamase class C family)
MLTPEDLLTQNVTTLFPGGVVGTVDVLGQSQTWCSGTLGGETDTTPVTANTLYDVASITKSIPTSCVALKLWEQEKLDLDEPIVKYFPHIQGGHAAKVTITDLLQNTVLFPQQLSRLKNLSAQELHDVLTHSQVVGQPGEIFAYSNTNSILLTWIIKEITGQTLEQLSQKFFFGPLQMNSTTWQPSLNGSNIAPSEHDPWRGRDIRGEVHDESAWVLSAQYGAVGSAGLFSTVPDLLHFGLMLLQEGQWQNQTILQPETIIKLKQPHQLKSGEFVCLGWEWRPWIWAGDELSTLAIGKTGFTGCSFLLDWTAGKVVVILSNTTYPTRPPNREALNAFRRQVITQLLQNK